MQFLQLHVCEISALGSRWQFQQEIVENFPSPKTWEWNLPHSQIHNPSLHHSKSLLPSIMYVFPVNCWWVIYWFIPPQFLRIHPPLPHLGNSIFLIKNFSISQFFSNSSKLLIGNLLIHPPIIFTYSFPPFPTLVLPYSSSKIFQNPNFFSNPTPLPFQVHTYVQCVSKFIPLLFHPTLSLHRQRLTAQDVAN